MPIKKSDLYSKLWASCDELRGGMDASQYKDYVLVLLFIKYISDKYAGEPFAPIQIPDGASFADMVALKGRSDIGDQINKRIVRPLEEANGLRIKADFNDDALLGAGKEKVDKLTNLIGIFESGDLDFSQHRADGDDILGDAYEYLMRHFATESGKSKGQFYTPAEVSRVMAQLLGIAHARTSPDTTVYDPTCGSGSLLLKVAEAAPTGLSLYGQEKEEATSGLARMNMILHDNPGAVIEQGNTLADPKFLDGEKLKTFDYVVANPPFSDKRWSTGLTPSQDAFGRFDGFVVPPDKQGDYAYLLHILRSLKSTGRAACILPHGVLFRGHAEAEIRKRLVQRGLILAIIGLPANLFYGTGIPACILVLDKAQATERRGIFMIDAAQGFMKDGPKNRLRERDIHRIVDAFTTLDASDPRYARWIGFDEIEKNDFNLNLPRYIDSSTPEDPQDIDAHLRGGIPEADVAALGRYWAVCPQLRDALFRPRRAGYLDLTVAPAAIKTTIHQHAEFQAFTQAMAGHFEAWRVSMAPRLKDLAPGFQPKALIRDLAEDLLAHYRQQPAAQALIDPYAVFQHLMDYWAETMQDDAYLIDEAGWTAEPRRVLETKKTKDGSPGKTVDRGWACDLVPKALLVQQHFAASQAALDGLAAELEAAQAAQAELEEEHGGEDAALGSLDKINDKEVKTRLREIGRDPEAAEELAVLRQWLTLSEKAGALKKKLKTQEAALDAQALARYATLTADEVKALVVDHKWMAALGRAVHCELDRVSQALTGRVKELAERYGRTMPELTQQVTDLEARVAEHLAKMGFV
ncbi:type I restriction-modification system specificity subunit [Sphaerotilus natans subsp. natans DSM 6575]|uniref:site-specific DNA-methyltransferase (adenine-specific) n=1 Tax=Sphaerotilus natans subsp. natans DSM 6575 TaxID=1286631 RepID=A0A059KKN9_9BURK|nr:class I SAM-dependent DNA methyltransferase [Sphaerotilus natans]KDB51678.1 type I restriction-modification system specificity subunit [Sphaerotilus natans subsp. natans DSM 6575]SIS04305.1 type I restriction enzyme M protein [Sphaerotilus natans]